jgi:hypothetical protein
VKQSNQLFHYAKSDGTEVTVRQGVVVPDNHPDVKGHEQMFDDVGGDDTPARRSRHPRDN